MWERINSCEKWNRDLSRKFPFNDYAKYGLRCFVNLMSVEAYLSAKNAEQLFLFDRMASVGIAFRRSGEKYLRNQRLNSATIAGNSCESNPASPARAVGCPRDLRLCDPRRMYHPFDRQEEARRDSMGGLLDLR